MRLQTALFLSLSAVGLMATGAAHAHGGGHKKPAKNDSVVREIATIADGDHRSEKNRARNASRRPAQTLAFFGIKPDMTVVEVAPGGGWYTEVLAPYLKQNGKYYAAHYDPNHEREYYRNSVKRYGEKLSANPALYGDVELTVFSPPETMAPAPDGSADMVITFRNTHGWMRGGHAEAAFAAMHKALKPGGILGIVQHRGDPKKDQDPEAGSGYVREDLMIKMVEAAGFKLEDHSEINANPRDTKDYPQGVWNLPPSFRDKDVERAKYAAIGESDRMTLKFVKK
ncbi:MAG: class I SAM-dependent methyltransferase [Gammaproteobacteria bacterium]